MYYFALNVKEHYLVMKRCEYKTAMVLLFSSLCLFTSGPAGFLSVALAKKKSNLFLGVIWMLPL